MGLALWPASEDDQHLEQLDEVVHKKNAVVASQGSSIVNDLRFV